MKYVYMYNGEYCLALKGKEMLLHATSRMSLENSMLNEAIHRRANNKQLHLHEIIEY